MVARWAFEPYVLLGFPSNDVPDTDGGQARACVACPGLVQASSQAGPLLVFIQGAEPEV